MKEITQPIPEQSWDTINSKYPANSIFVGNDQLTAGSKNFETDVRGVITKRQDKTVYGTISAPEKDAYEAVFSDGVHHRLSMQAGSLYYTSGDGANNLVQAGYSPLGNMEFASYFDRVYFGNGIDNPQVYDRVTTYGGVTYTAPKTKVMGAQIPSSAPTAAVGGAGNVPIGSYTYKITYLYYEFEESNGSTASAVVSPGVASQINLTAIPVGGYGVTARKVYRDNGTGVYRLVGTVANNTATVFTDNVATGTALIPVDNGLPPNFSLITQHKDRNWFAGIAGDKSELQFSEAGFPDVVTSTNFILCNPRDPITALFVYNDRVMVMNRSSFGQILGTTADTFYYSEVPGNVGCVDNRSVQVRVINGVPVLVWLSDKGFYAYNGSSVTYISNDIEDLVNFNIQQGSATQGSNSQSSQLDFQGGTSSPGINLVSTPGTITTIGDENPPVLGGSTNPKKALDTQAEWEGGSQTTAIVTRRTDIPNTLAQAKKNTFLKSAGSNAGTRLINGNIMLPTASDNTGEAPPQFTLSNSIATPTQNFDIDEVATKISLARAGTITSIAFNVGFRDAGTHFSQPGTLKLYTGVSVPSTLVFSAPITFVTTEVTTVTTVSGSVSWPVAAGNYWLAFRSNNASINAVSDIGRIGITNVPWSGGTNCYTRSSRDGVWAEAVAFGTSGPAVGKIAGSYTFVQTSVGSGGTWTSLVYDSGLYPHTESISVDLNHTTTFNSGTSTTSYVDQADSLDMSVGLVSQSTPSLNGTATQSFTLTKRFWRIRLVLAATDDRFTPIITSEPTLTYPDTSTFTSASVDHTTDITALNFLDVAVQALPTGTTATAIVQKSILGVVFTNEGSFPLVLGTNNLVLGSVTNPTQRYTRIKFVLTNTGDRTLTPEITSATLRWSLTSNLISSAIDTGATPAGWDLFQTSFSLNGGTVSFSMRSSATLIGLGAATWFTVTNGTFPNTVPVNQWVQWRTTLSASADMVPTVDSVTINWFVTLTQSIRPASLFVGTSYYVSLAEFNQTANNLILKFDQEGKWRILRGISASTLSLFFNRAYFGAGDEAKIYRFLEGRTSNVEMDIRTKSFDWGTRLYKKGLRKLVAIVKNTGATYTPYYSTDDGATFKPLYASDGSASFTTTTDGGISTHVLVPGGADNFFGKALMARLHNNDMKDAEVHELRIIGWMRQGDILNG